MECTSSDPLEPIPVALVEATGGTHDSAPPPETARLLILAAAILWSSSGLFVKAPWFHGWSGAALAFWRALFASIVLWPLVRRPEWTWGLIPMTLFFAAMNYAYLTSMALGTAANAIWLQFTAPAWVLLCSVLIFKERAIPRDWLLVACAATGVGLIISKESYGASREAVAWGLVAGVAYAGVVLTLRHLRTHDPVWLAALNHTVTAALLAPFAFAEGAPFPAGIQWLLLVAFGIFQMSLPYVLFTRGLKTVSAHEATGLGLIEPILVPLWTYLVWHERCAWWTIAGGALILVGLAIRYFDFSSGRAK